MCSERDGCGEVVFDVGLLGLLSVRVVLSSTLALVVLVWTLSGMFWFLILAIIHIIQSALTWSEKISAYPPRGP